MLGVEVRDFGFKNEKAKENRSETELWPQFQGHLLHLSYITFSAVYLVTQLRGGGRSIGFMSTWIS